VATLDEADQQSTSFLNEATSGFQGATDQATANIQNTSLFQPPALESPSQEELTSGVKQGSAYITPESMVSNQMTSLLASDSPYMKQAENVAKQKAQSMGLLSSSMAVGAAQGESIRAALPIAQQDAKAYTDRMAGQQTAENQIQADRASGLISGALKQRCWGSRPP